MTRLERAPSANGARTRKLAYHETPGRRPRQFFFYEPEARSEKAPLVVSVHGIARNAAAHVYRLMTEAERFGLPIVAPLFDKDLFGQYQQLLDMQTGARADLALIDIIEAAGRLSHVRTDQVLLFGYSGGAQFTHRFVFAHPRRVMSAVHVAAGWYTFPDPDLPYPFGLRVREKASTITLDLAQALKVPQHVLVGSCDVERNSSLRQSRRIDEQQGDSRLNRARNWVGAMDLAAQHRPGSIKPTFAIMPHVGHSFVDSVESSALPNRIFQNFVKDAGLAPVQG